MKIRRQWGAQVVEFALVLPFLLLFLLIIIELSFLVYDKAVITNASREAARYGTLLTGTPWSVSKVEDVAKEACKYAGNSLITTNTAASPGSCSAPLAASYKYVCPGNSGLAIWVAPNANVTPNFGTPVSVQVAYAYTGLLKTFQTTTFQSVWTLCSQSTMNHE